MEEGNLAEELYSESLQLSKVKLNPSAVNEEEEEEEGDGSFWGEELNNNNKSTDLDREWERRRHQFHTIGYRDGLIAGKEAIAQIGFNIGFRKSALVGFDWGLVRGITSAFACLPDGLKERLVEQQEMRNKFQGLHESVHSVSTTDALKLFHDDLIASEEQIEHDNDNDKYKAAASDTPTSLGNYVEKLHSLLLESPAIPSHLSVK